MKKKKNRKKRRPNPLRYKSPIPPQVYRQLAETMIAQGIGNIVLDAIDPLPSGPRIPHLELPLIEQENGVEAGISPPSTTAPPAPARPPTKR